MRESEIKKTELNKRSSRLTRATVCLVFLVLISMYLFPRLAARFVSDASEEENARVAKFEITENGELTQELEVELIPGDTQNKSIEIENNSEVAVAYFITVKNESANITPLDFELTEIDETGQTVETDTAVTKENNTWTFSGQNQTANSVRKYSLNILWQESEGSEDENLKYMGMVDYISVTIRAEQIN